MLQRRCLVGFCAVGFVCQFAGCDLTQITTTVTVDGRQLISGAIRDAILTPLDTAITEAVNDLFGVNQ
jgi:hypothetical protein